MPTTPFALRARVLTPLAAGGFRFERDGVVEVGADGRIAAIGPYAGQVARDLRPRLVLPGLVDLHVHLPQIPAAGVGAGLELLPWLERHVFPLERSFDREAAARLAPLAFRALARAGTTTAVLYGAVFEPSLDEAFRAAEEHGLRAVLGKTMMDRITYGSLPPERVLETSLAESARLAARWHGADGGRLLYAVTPRFAVSCTAEMLRESAALARETGTYWQTHLSENRAELDRVAELFPEALDYLDVYDAAGGLGRQALLAHAIHLSDRELARVVETGSVVVHCPTSNLFLASGLMPLARYLDAGVRVGLGSDVAGGPELSLFAVMKAGAYVQGARQASGDPQPPLRPLDWLRLATLDGARALGLDAVTGSLEPGKDADLIVVDPALTLPPGGEEGDDPQELVSRLIFRGRPDMVAAAYVRGRLLPA